MKSKAISKIVIILLFVISILLLFLILTYLALIFSRGGEEGVVYNTSTLKEYKFRSYDPSTNETYRGITKQNEISNELGFISYENSIGTLILISEFGTTEYRCTGNCICEDNNSERRGSSASSKLVKSLTFLVASLSSILVLDTAKDYFSDLCVEEISSSCDEVSIRSEIEDCEEVVYPYLDQEKKDHGDYFEDYEEETVIFWCKGHCLPNIYDQDFPRDGDLELLYRNRWMSTLTEYEVEQAESYGCEKMELEGEVWLDPGHDYPKWKKEQLRSSEEKMLREARDRFMHKWLEEYCIQNSIEEGNQVLCTRHNPENLDCYYKIETFEQQKELCLGECDHGAFNTMPMCVGHDNADALYDKKFEEEEYEGGLGEYNPQDDENKSVECIFLEHKTNLYRAQLKIDEKEEKKGWWG